MKHFSRSSWFASHRRHWFSLKKFIPSNLLSSLVILLLGDILLLIRDDCRCNYRNSCSVDVRSDIFEEDPCPGTGKYIEAQYYCLGWCTHTYLFDRLFNRLLSSTSYTRETGFTIFPSLLNDEDDDNTITRKKKINFGESLNYSYYSSRTLEKGVNLRVRKNWQQLVRRKSLSLRPNNPSSPISSIRNDDKRKGTGSMVQYTLVRVYVRTSC